MMGKQKLDWDLTQKYVQALPGQEHTQLLTVQNLSHEDKYYTFCFGEGENDVARPMGFPMATYRGADGRLYVSQTRYNHHTLTAASSGSGKTQGVIINCAFNADPRMSYVFSDPKGEIVKASYKRLCQIYGEKNVLVANFLDPAHSMVYYNPFTDFAHEWIVASSKKNKKQIRDNIIFELKKLFEILCPVESEKDKSWERTARSFLLGLVLGLFEDLTLTDEQVKRTGRQRTTPEMINFETLLEIYHHFKWSERTSSFDDGGFLSTRRRNSLARELTYSVTNNAGTTRANYLGFVDLYLGRYTDPKILEMSRFNSINAMDLIDSPKVLLFAYDITHEASRDYVNLWVARLISDMLESSHKQASALKTPIHFVLDEFATLRPCAIYPNLLATGRGSNIFMHMVVQSLEQLHARYREEWLTMIDNCDVQFYLGSNSLNTAKHFAETLGTTTATDPVAFLRGEFRIIQMPVVSLDYLLHRMDHGEAFALINNGQPLHTGFELYYKVPEYKDYPIVHWDELKSPYPNPRLDKNLCRYHMPQKQATDEVDLEFLLQDEENDEILFNDDAGIDEYDWQGLSQVAQWTQKPFVYDRTTPEKRDDYAMDRIEDLVALDRQFVRQDVIDLLKILIKINRVHENDEMLELLLHEFSVATDEEYNKLKKHVFDE